MIMKRFFRSGAAYVCKRKSDRVCHVCYPNIPPKISSSCRIPECPSNNTDKEDHIKLSPPPQQPLFQEGRRRRIFKPDDPNFLWG